MSYITVNGLKFPVLNLTTDGEITADLVGKQMGILAAGLEPGISLSPVYNFDTTGGEYPYKWFVPAGDGESIQEYGSDNAPVDPDDFSYNSTIQFDTGFTESYPTYMGLAVYKNVDEYKFYYVIFSNLSFTADVEPTTTRPSLATNEAYGTVTGIEYTSISRGTYDDLYEDIFTYSDVPEDPYEPGGYSGAGWGTGNFDATSDIIGMPELPTVSAIDTGFLTLFTPSLAQLQSFQEYLWSDLLEGIKDGSLTDIVDSLKKIVSDPYQAIMGLSIVPVSVPTAGSKDVKMYGVLDSGVVMPYASTQWIEVNCGSLNVNEFWGNYMDYAPYTKITSLYLPFVGVVSVDVDEIMKKTVTIKYRVDILSGQCIAFIIVNGSVEYQYQGHCATSLPITASDFSSTINAGLNLISHVSAGVAGIAGGAISGALTGGIGGAIGAVGAAASAANNIASDVMNAKPNIKAGSSVGGAGGLLSVKKPYFIAIRPKQCVATYQKSFTGFPINETYAIRQLTGYTEFERINLDGIPLTQPEKEELEGLLMGGVYL